MSNRHRTTTAQYVLVLCLAAVLGEPGAFAQTTPVFTEDQQLSLDVPIQYHLGLGLAGSGEWFVAGGRLEPGTTLVAQWTWDVDLGAWQEEPADLVFTGFSVSSEAPIAQDACTAVWYEDQPNDPMPKIRVSPLPDGSQPPPGVIWLDGPLSDSVAALTVDGFNMAAGDGTYGGNEGWMATWRYNTVNFEWDRTSTWIGNPGSYFGQSVAVDGEYLAIGAPHLLDGSPGSVFVFKEDPDDLICSSYYCNWDTLSIAQTGNRFGAAVALDGNWLAVGASRQDSSLPPFQDRGTVFLYERDATGHFVLRDSVSGPGPTVYFGASVALFETLLLVGAPGEDFDIGGMTLENVGAAYLFQRSGSQFNETAKLVGSSPQPGMNLGRRVALTANAALAGAPYANVAVEASGAVLSWKRLPSVFADGFESGDTSIWSTTIH